MLSNDSTNGFFADLPYFDPVESSTFFEQVASHGLHKLSEKLMVGCRSLEYFAKPESSQLHAVLKDSIQRVETKRSTKVSSFRFPTLRQHLDSNITGDATHRTHICTVTLAETESRLPDGMEGSTVELNFKGIEAVWTALIKYGFGACHHQNFVFPNVDLSVAESSGVGELFLTLLFIGVKSITDFFSDTTQRTGEKPPIGIFMTVLSDEFGKSNADAIQFFAESALQMAVRRTFCDEIPQWLSLPFVTVRQSSTHEEWLEGLREGTVDAHEELCDQMDDMEIRPSRMRSPIIVVIIPLRRNIREPVRKALADSYSSEPVRVVQEIDWERGSFAGPSPVIFLCSASWIIQQASCSSFDRLLDRLDIRWVVHGGFCEYGTGLNDEVCTSVSLLKTRMIPECPVAIHTHSATTFTSGLKFETDPILLSQVGNVILLIYRRFLLHYSPETQQPYFALSQSMFFSGTSWNLYLRSITELSLAGAVKIRGQGSDSPTVELTVLGRFLSFRFRIIDEATPYARAPQEFCPRDVKTIMWSHLFRQGQDLTSEIIKENYAFHEWVASQLADFCNEHKIFLQAVTDVHRGDLIRQLASFGFSGTADDMKNRAHFLLSLPFGRRVPLSSHGPGVPVTTSRGWYDQAPLRLGLSLEKRQVSVFCLPSSGLFCELEGPREDDSFRIQCPTEISYPLIVAHSALHISLHNNCVFLESLQENNAVPLPLSLLQSHTMNALLRSAGFGEVGFWLDGVLSDKTLAPSDPSMFRPLLQHRPSVIGFCERDPFRRKRKRKEEANKKAVAKEEFTGVKPRSLTEEDTIEGFTKLVVAVGREKAEASLRGKKGFSFLEPSHELHPYYVFVLRTKEKDN